MYGKMTRPPTHTYVQCISYLVALLDDEPLVALLALRLQKHRIHSHSVNQPDMLRCSGS